MVLPLSKAMLPSVKVMVLCIAQATVTCTANAMLMCAAVGVQVICTPNRHASSLAVDKEHTTK